jgi:hypothetical protein
VTNTNLLNLTQQVNSYANTGNNTTDGNIGNVAGVLVTGNANSQTNMDVHANTNCTLIGNTSETCPTNMPVGGPADPSDPATSSNPQSSGNVGGGNVDAASTSSSSSSSSAPATAGQVLGALLPATGPEAGMMMVALSIAGILGGIKLRKFSN